MLSEGGVQQKPFKYHTVNIIEVNKLGLHNIPHAQLVGTSPSSSCRSPFNRSTHCPFFRLPSLDVTFRPSIDAESHKYTPNIYLKIYHMTINTSATLVAFLRLV